MLYMLTDPNAIILKCLEYTGPLVDMGGKGHTTKLVLELLKNYLDRGHSIYLDKFYKSFERVDKLTSRNTYCTGTLSAKRTKQRTCRQKVKKRRFS